MTPLLEFNFFTMLLMLAVAMFVWFLVAHKRDSARRMKCMMAELGLEYDMAATSDPAIEAIMKGARARCLRCRNEDMCERWLALVQDGIKTPGVSEEDFCPNAATFKELAARGGLQSESGDDVTPSRAPSP